MLLSDELIIKRSAKIFLVILSVIVVIGLLMVFSASYLYSSATQGNSLYYFFKQIAFLAISIFIFIITYKTKINFWLKYIDQIMFLFIFLILLTFIPGVGVKVKGANRWINLYFINFQPAEFFKYVLIIYSSKFLLNFNQFKNSLRHYFLLFIPFTLLMLQPDFGTLVICFSVLVFVAFLSDLNKKILYGSLGSGIVGLFIILISKPYRVKRLMAYLDPWANEQGSGFQIIQSFLAFANGGIFGKGLGNSQEKLFYLPEAHNDFIFSVLGEELGFIGVFFLIAIFASLCFYGFKISNLLHISINKIMSSSFIFVIILQALLNISVVLGLLPTKGLVLPFISTGGSSLIANFFAIGLIFSCARSEIGGLFKEHEINYDSSSNI